MQNQGIARRMALAVMGVALLPSLVACSTPNKSQTMMQDGTSQTMPHEPGATAMPMGGMSHGELGPADENFDLLFIDAMIPHHQGAIVMAQEALEKSTRPEIKQLAEAIISAQEQEIQQLQTWRSTWYPKAGNEPMMYHADMNHMMPMTQEHIDSMMMKMDLGAADNGFDLRFINAMIPHHEGAVVMAQEALQKSTRPEIKQLAEAIISAQQQEIEEMKQWRKDWYNQ